MRLKQMVTGLIVGLLTLQPATSAHAGWAAQYSDVETWPSWAISGKWMSEFGERFYDAWGGEMAEVVWWELMIGDPPANGDLWRYRTFRPNDTITRAEYATILVRAMDLPYAERPGEAWYRPYVDALTQRGIISQVGDVMQPMTRREMGEWVGRSLAWYGVKPTPGRDFPDTINLPEAPFIRLATGAGVIKGLPDGTFGAERTAIRAEGAAMVVRLVKQFKKNLPAQDTLQQLIADARTVDMQLFKMAIAGQQYDHSLPQKYFSPMYLDGPDGLHYETKWNLIADRAFWRELTDLKVEPLLVRDTVALVKSTFTLVRKANRYLSEAEKQPMTGTTYDFLVKRNGRWVLAESNTFRETPVALRPQAEVISP